MSRVLVADDDPDIVALVRIALETSGHEVVITGDGEEAWAACQETVPDLAVLDVSMPRMDGLELCRRLRASPTHAALPILVLTASVQPVDTQRAHAAGATAVVTKPFSPKALAARAGELLAQGDGT